jgi:hypothetical protein
MPETHLSLRPAEILADAVGLLTAIEDSPEGSLLAFVATAAALRYISRRAPYPGSARAALIARSVILSIYV